MDWATDPLTRAAIAAAESVRRAAERRWRPALDDDEAVEAADAARILAREAIEHLNGGRWDEAIAGAERAVELDETHGDGEVWREFALRVEEAAETGRGVTA